MFRCPSCHSTPSDGKCACGLLTIENGAVRIGKGYSEYVTESFGAKVDEWKPVGFMQGEWALRHSGLAGPGLKSLSVGCGLGYDVLRLRELGCEAYGVDAANLIGMWGEIHGSDRDHMACVTEGPLPFADNSFDLVLCVDVLEHVGTIPPEEWVSDTTEKTRAGFIAELLRVAKPGGAVVIACINKSFPIDFWHPHHYVPFAPTIYRKFKFSPTIPWSKQNFAPSHADLQRWVDGAAKDGAARARLSFFHSPDYFIFNQARKSLISRVAARVFLTYVKLAQRFLPAQASPFVFARIEKI